MVMVPHQERINRSPAIYARNFVCREEKRQNKDRLQLFFNKTVLCYDELNNKIGEKFSCILIYNSLGSASISALYSCSLFSLRLRRDSD